MAIFARPEDELLVCCARIDVPPAIADRITALLDAPLDWVYLQDLAQRHAVGPLLNRSLRAVCPERVSEVVLSQLAAAQAQNTRRALQLSGELLKLLRIFAPVPVLPIKGPVLALMAYGNLALRDYADLDVVIHERDLVVALARLQSLDLTLDADYTPSTEYVRTEYHYRFVDADRSVGVEVHWRLAPRHYGALAAPDLLWRDAQTFDYFGLSALAPRPEAYLLYLCGHGFRHLWSKLAWLCDIAELLRTSPDFDWSATLEEARRLQMMRVMLLGIGLARDVLAVPLPDEIVRLITADRVVQRLIPQLRRDLFASHPKSAQELRRYLLHLRIIEDRRTRLRYLRHVGAVLLRRLHPNAQDRGVIKLPRALSFLYYLIRPLRLIVIYGPALIRRNRVQHPDPSPRDDD
ncbi:MAG: nucleotidyltransferase family protein [Chloroflexi bacterium]|nr:nucleotidyltransferase family protein [Chloroflexota bacterium]